MREQDVGTKICRYTIGKGSESIIGSPSHLRTGHFTCLQATFAQDSRFLPAMMSCAHSLVRPGSVVCNNFAPFPCRESREAPQLFPTRRMILNGDHVIKRYGFLE
jgi:hypothetical protein